MPPIKRPHSGLLAEAAPLPAWLSVLTQIAFLLSLTLVCARAFMVEPLYNSSDQALVLANAPRVAGPATSLTLDLLACMPAFLILLRRLLDRAYVLRFAWSHAVMAGLAIWMVLSVTWAADRFIAMLNAAHFICALVLLWSATQLVRSWGRLRIVAAAGFGLLLIFAAAGLNQRLVDYPAQVREWNDPNSEVGRAAYLKSHNLKPDDFEFKVFESNLLSGDLRLFGNSPNTYAAALVLLLVVSLGILWQRLANRDRIGWAIVILLPLPAVAFCIYHSHSITAYVTPILALTLFLAVLILRNWLPAHAKLAYWMGVGIVALGTAALVFHGLYHHSLFIKTLTFRWYYWTGAARLLHQHPLTGVGWSNFGYFYPAVRDALATEQVKDPHNFLVRAFAELGIIGGLLMLAWMLRLAWELTRPVAPAGAAASPVQGKMRGILFLAIPAVSAVGLNLLASVDFNQPGAYVTLQAIERLAAAALLLAGLAAAALRSLKDERIDERPCPWVLYGILIALALLLLHNLIDFSLYEPGPMFLFALLAGSALGVRQPSVAGKTRKNLAVIIGSSLAAILLIAAIGAVYVPTVIAESSATAGDAALRDGHYGQAAGNYSYAFKNQSRNAEYAFRAAQAAASTNVSGIQLDGMIQLAIEANPRVIRYYVFRANVELARPSPDAEAIRRSYRSAIKLDPRDVDLRLEYAGVLERLGDRPAAIEQYMQALSLDSSLPASEVRRLSPAKRAEIESKVHRFYSPAIELTPATSPAAR